ncbi:peroxidase family protein [Glycomyces xiaoerkulensis]|uniref:peroxidase family protein n=1 Tax=Glycomyces xiaoerkulensis TaxID=2038139 RepID=UPI0018E43D9F|nr:peroxidase family protein [Glycomyces xiaoerkulensis]
MAQAQAPSPSGPGVLQTPADRFARMYPNLGPYLQATDQARAAMMAIGEPGGVMDANDDLEAGPVELITNPDLRVNNPDNPNHTAGVHFFGQFLDHDMTFDLTSPLGVPTPPEDSPNSRTPAFDLDSIYGGGPDVDPEFYESDGRRLRIESGGLFEDIPREADGSPIIADFRNDEHAIISGLHAAFIMFHNNVVRMLESQGFGGDVFAEARRLVTWHYQWLIVHTFLPLFIGQAMVDDIAQNGRRFYTPDPGPTPIPVEFQVAYRFGHSMVRPSYRLNQTGDGGEPFFGFIFDPAAEGQDDPDDLRGNARAPRRFVGWETFFDFGDGAVRQNKRIDTTISTPLFQLPLLAIPTFDEPVALPQRNLLRHLTWSVPSGQQIAQWMGERWIHLQDEMGPYGLGLENQTPLWFYVLAEAERDADGLTLGPAGGRIVGEVFFGLLELDPSSYLAAEPDWEPTLPSQTPGDFLIQDLLRFAGVDPESRGLL